MEMLFHRLTRIRPRTIRARGNLSVHDWLRYFICEERFGTIKGAMSRPKARDSLTVRDHVTGEGLKVEIGGFAQGSGGPPSVYYGVAGKQDDCGEQKGGQAKNLDRTRVLSRLPSLLLSANRAATVPRRSFRLRRL